VLVLIVLLGAVLGWGVVAVRGRERELAAREAELADFFENAVVGLHWVGPDGIILRANQADMALLDYRHDEYVGRHIAEFHADQDVIADILRRLTAGEKLQDYPARLRRKDGAIKDVLIDSSVMWEDGRFVHTRCFTRDVTDRKRLQDELERKQQEFATLVENSPDVIFRLDYKLRHLYVNPAVTLATGWTPEHFLGKTGLEAGLPESFWKGFEPKCRRTLETGEPQSFEFEYESPQGKQFYQARVVREPASNGDGPTLLGITTNITNLREAEAALRDADRRKDEFLATLAHELRNPLAPIRNSLEVMKQAKGRDDLMGEARATMERQLRQMVRLIDDLLDVSRITRNRIELRKERVELASILHHAIEACQPLIEAARHNLSIALPSDPIYLNADPVRLAQIFGNLLTNSCKYTELGGRIWLTADRQGSDVIVTVKDTGVGIPSDMLPHIFDMFTQVDRSLERSQGGLGIGLTLVQRLVEMHDGSVTASSAGRGRGSEFSVRLPMLSEPPPVSRSARAPDETLPTAGRRILIVDDNRDSATTLAMLLRLSGHEIRTAYDGDDAVEQAAAYQPDVILLDIGLPGMNGYDACRAIRKLPAGKSIVLVALTGWGQEEDRRKSREAGFDDHLVKPVDHDALSRLLAPRRPGSEDTVG
jgi:PAS domain S-box-containing protein